MAITKYVPDSFHLELSTGIHDFTTDVFKLALFTQFAGLSKGTTAYSTAGEIVDVNYTAGGEILTITVPAISNNKVVIDFDDYLANLSPVTATIGYAMIYNSSKADRAVGIYQFGPAIDSSNQYIYVTFPAADSDNAIIRIKQVS